MIRPMPPHVVFMVSLISLVLCMALAGMVTAWIWALGRLWSGKPLLPEAKPRTVPWRTSSVLAVILTWVAVNVSVSWVYLSLTGARGPGKTPSLTDQMVAVSLINGVLLCVIPPILRLTSGASLKDLGLDTRDLGRQALVGTTGFLLVAPVVYLVNLLAVRIWEQNRHPLEQMVTARPTLEIAVLAFFSAVILAPAAEELFFRAILQSWLTQLLRRHEDEDDLDLRQRELAPAPHDVAAVESSAAPGAVMVPGAVTPVSVEGERFSGHWTAPSPDQAQTGPDQAGDGEDRRPPDWVPHPEPETLPRDDQRPPRRDRAALLAIVLTSALFAAVHLPQWPAPVAIFILSLGLGVVYQRTGSLFASSLMHALFNGFSTLILFQAILVGQPADPKAAPTATYSTSVAAPGGAPAIPRLNP
jgi:membrane protease YdiL (CAAX protease family)